MIFGIRHHGPGSAASLEKALREFEPDIVLIEGPPEANPLIKYVANGSALIPPVALLAYASDDARQACSYPFAEFSPEWRAMLYANEKGLPCRFIDLAQSNWLALTMQLKEEKLAVLGQTEMITDPNAEGVEDLEGLDLLHEDENLANLEDPKEKTPPIHKDPIGTLARAAGYEDSEVFWEQLIEQRRQREGDACGIFSALLEAMQALRAKELESQIIGEVSEKKLDYDDDEDNLIEPLREVAMRQNIRQAKKEGFQKIAIVCGAWHAPALTDVIIERKGQAKLDAAALKGLPKQKLETTWIPWTNDRLSFASGYGAGITAPGWYEHIFCTEGDPTLPWLVKAASFLRSEDLDASSAQVIDAVRLAEALTSLRELPHPGLSELNEAILACLLGGNPLPLRLIENKLLIGERLGRVPPDIPGTPLTNDTLRQAQKLRLKQEALSKTLELDLRKPLDLERSYFLNRLNILNVAWGQKQRNRIKTSTFHEDWKLEWRPEMSLALIEASIWGKNLIEASSNKLMDAAKKCASFKILVTLLGQALEANLEESIKGSMRLASERSNASLDVSELMSALPVLVSISRYGNVREIDADLVKSLVGHLSEKVIINLEAALVSLDDDAARSMMRLISDCEEALRIYEENRYIGELYALLDRLARKPSIHPLISGKTTKLLFDARRLNEAEAGAIMQFSLSKASSHAYSGMWLEGFLTDNAQVLIHDHTFFQVVDNWLQNLENEQFQELLPLLRKVMGPYSISEKRNIQERVVSQTNWLAKAEEEVSDNDLLLLPVLNKVLSLLGATLADRHTDEVQA
jgi:hypothetical protein